MGHVFVYVPLPLTVYNKGAEVVRMYHTLLGEEGFRLHAVCSAITGLVSATAAAPCDLIKTRCMNAPGELSTARCLSLAIKEGGFIGLFRGWMPSYCRLGPHSLIQFPLLEQLRLFLGLGHF